MEGKKSKREERICWLGVNGREDKKKHKEG